MSTSNSGTFIAGAPPATTAGEVPELRGLAPSAPLDPSVLARLANEFFTALPGAEQPAFSQLSGADPASLTLHSQPPVLSAPNQISFPSDPQFSSLPAGAGPAEVAPVSTTVQAGPPAIPGPAAGSLPNQQISPTGFSFLDEARPVAAAEPARQSAVPYPEAKPITSYLRSDAPREVPKVDFEAPFGNELDFHDSPPSPTVPSALAPVDSSAIPAFSFLEEARPIFSNHPAIPGPAPSAVLENPKTLKVQEPSTGPGSAYDPLRPGAFAPFGFLEDTRGIGSDRATEAPEPATIEPNVPRDLNLSSYSFDAHALRRDFPILQERVHGRQLVWLDNAATTQKPLSVIERLNYYYKHENSNVHRAAHELAARATDAYESAREKVRRFLNAPSAREIVFVRGATEGINLIAQSWGRQNVKKDDEIVITWLEHHANIVPWQMLCKETGARLRVAPVDATGQILLDEYEKLLGPKTRLVSITQVSNALGVVTPAAAMIESAHRYGAKVLLDGAQSVSHMRVDVQALDCDFFVFSGHKVFAPTGIGVVYGKPEVLEHMQPWQGGGNMIQDVTFERTVYQAAPQRFEAGTGNIGDAVGLGAAIDYLDRVGMENISRHEHELLVYATQHLNEIPGLHIIGTAREKAGVLSFVLDGFRTEEVGDYLNRNGIAVRSGHHCAQPILRRFGLESTVRASLALYNTKDDIDALITALRNLRQGHTVIA
jgi:cysteine desulfurase/selenocysteine lyase